MNILYTSALIPAYYDQRKREYIESFNTLQNFGYANKTKIIECYDLSNNTFLNELTDSVYYTKLGARYNNKGVNELLNLRCFLDNNVTDDKFVKLTGRYKLNDPYFLNYCRDDDEYDVIVKQTMINQYFFGLFCVKRQVFVDYLNWVNIDRLNASMTCVENDFADYVINSGLKVKHFDRLNICCNINNEDYQIL